MNDRYRLYNRPALKSPSLLVSWNEDVSKIGTKVADYLRRKAAYRVFAEIEPAEFFALAGVTVEDNLVQFPESKFYWCPANNLLILEGDPPGYDWFSFLDLVLEIAQDQCYIKELYAIGGMISLAAHTVPRQIMGVFNSPEIKQSLAQYNLASEMEYQTPPGHRPTLNSFLLWAAKRRHIPGANLWIPMPFYLLAPGDPSSQKKAIEFLNQRFDLRLDLSDLDEEIGKQTAKMAELRDRFPDLSRSISLLESNQALSEEDNEKLVKGVQEFFAAG